MGDHPVVFRLRGTQTPCSLCLPHRPLIFVVFRRGRGSDCTDISASSFPIRS